MPLGNILYRLIKARLDSHDDLAEYLSDHLAHMIENLSRTEDEEDWRIHESGCKRCMEYILQFEMLKEYVITREIKEE